MGTARAPHLATGDFIVVEEHEGAAQEEETHDPATTMLEVTFSVMGVTWSPTSMSLASGVVVLTSLMISLPW